MHVYRRNNRGMSLIELMIAVTIGLIILAAVSAIFVNSRRSFNTQDRMARLQENARFAINYLTRDLRMAGHTGCLKDMGSTKSMLNNTAFMYTPNIAIEGINNAAANWSPSGTAYTATGITGVLAGTDAIAIRVADPSVVASVNATMLSASAPITLTSATGFSATAQNEIVLISDCATADVFKITSVAGTVIQHATGGTPGNNTTSLSKKYDSAARVMQFKTRIYYIGTRAADGMPVLYMQDNMSVNTPKAAAELVEGVEDMQILYGVDTDPSTSPDTAPNVYLPAGVAGLTTPAQWGNVKTIRIGLLMRSPDNKDADPSISSTYNVNGSTFTVPAGDRYQRRVFVTTIQVRNM